MRRWTSCSKARKAWASTFKLWARNSDSSWMRFKPKACNQARNIIISSISMARFVTICYCLSKHRPSGPMLSISRFVCPSVRVCVCPTVCVFTFEVPFNGLFAPTSRSRMSNIFRDAKSLGKSNGKKWSQIWTFLFEICWKSRHKKKVFFSPLFSFFFNLLWFLVFFNCLCAPPSQSRMSNIFRDSESLGKSNGKKWSQIWTFSFENCLKLPRKKKFFFSHFFRSSSVFGLF